MTETKKPRSLADFASEAEKRKRGASCTICNLSQRSEIDEAYKRGCPAPVIVRWLDEEYDIKGISPGRVRYHITEHCDGPRLKKA